MVRDYQRLGVFVVFVMSGCRASDQAEVGARYVAHKNEHIEFRLPSNWKPVPGQENLFALAGDAPEKSQIKLQANQNPRESLKKIHQTWDGMREAAEKSGRLISSREFELNGFAAFELIQRAPAPSTELIPLEHQKAGDQIFHQVRLLRHDRLKVSTHLLVEVNDYEFYEEVFFEALQAIRAINVDD